MKYTPNFLQKIEGILLELNYKIRYEKGNFQSGSCILEEQKIIVINKFLTIEGKINTILDILMLNIEINLEFLADENKKFLISLKNFYKKPTIKEENLF